MIKKQERLFSPPFLNQGDLIGVTCPASKISREAVREGCGVLRSWGFEVKEGRTLTGHFYNFSAGDEVRLADLQEMLDDDRIKAIVFGRGGYGVLRILDQLNWEKFKKNPKWLCGYSDITALLLHVFKNCGIQSLHSVMCSELKNEGEAVVYNESLRDALLGKQLSYYFPGHELNRSGMGDGQLVGGNLCLLTALCGSSSQPELKNKILFLEDTGEYIYAVDRMMMTLKRAGLLRDLSGLIIGSFTRGKDTDEPFGQTEYELIYEKVKAYHYPVAFGFPVGHQTQNRTLKIGAFCRLRVEEEPLLEELV